MTHFYKIKLSSPDKEWKTIVQNQGTPLVLSLHNSFYIKIHKIYLGKLLYEAVSIGMAVSCHSYILPFEPLIEGLF